MPHTVFIYNEWRSQAAGLTCLYSGPEARKSDEKTRGFRDLSAAGLTCLYSGPEARKSNEKTRGFRDLSAAGLTCL